MEPQAYFLCEGRYISAEHIGRFLSLYQCILKSKNSSSKHNYEKS